MENEEVVIKKEYKEEPIKDMVSLYFWVRQRINEVTDSYKNYELMMESISIGSGMLKDNELKKEISTFLENERNYPKITDMEIQGDHTYSIGTGTAGTISVRPEDLEIGRKHLMDQLCNSIIPRLRNLDNKIMSKLIEENIIQIQNKTMSDLFENKLRGLINGVPTGNRPSS